MKDLLKRLKKKYNLKVGDIEFSPIMQCSIGLSMLYVEEVEKGCRTPFHLNYPDKQNAALWLSIALLRNFFLEDYINQSDDRVEEIDVETGEKVEIFDTVAIFRGMKAGRLCLEFSGQDTPLEFDQKLSKHLNKTGRSRVNKYALFGKNLKKLKKERDAISKLIEPEDPVLINEGILDSKILIIAGRGNTGDFANRLKEEVLYGSKLSDVFSSGKKIIIKPDLETYKFISADDSEDVDRFRQVFLKYIGDLLQALPDKKDRVIELKKSVEQNNYRTNKFLELYDTLLDRLDKEGNERIFNIRDIYPGIKEHLPKHLRAVIINDVHQLDIYQGTIDELLKQNIPVFVISNRYVDDSKSLSLFKNYFEQNKSDIRINWNRDKINQLSKDQDIDKEILDSRLWRRCVKFSKQKISISPKDSHPLDPIITKIQRLVSNLEGQEKLKEAYWKYFNPLVYSFKNSRGWREYHKELINSFLDIHNDVRTTIDSELNTLFSKAFKAIEGNRDSYKPIGQYQNIFIQSLDVDGHNYFFPQLEEGQEAVRKLDESNGKITFPGFPLNEPLGHFIVEAMSEYYLTDINIVCWQTEGKLTYNYLRRRLKAGYFFDNLPENWGLDQNVLLDSEKAINAEIDDILKHGGDEKIEVEEGINDEIELEKISNFKYSEYKKRDETSDSYIVTCNIIDFEGNKFMFLPKNSSILARLEKTGEDSKIKKAKFKDLNIGDEVFDYQISRHDLREMTKSVDGSEAIYNTLDIWRRSLWDIFKKSDLDINKVKRLLEKVTNDHSIDASPTRQNIKRWLFDRDMLSPAENNLKAILMANDEDNLVDKVPQIIKAYKAGKSLSSKVSRRIKSAIIERLKEIDNYDEGSFEISVDEHDISVQYRKIVNLQKTDIEVDYSQTRKFVN